ncbi:MAG TPA: HU family DNA-binding protein, partial [Thermoleophilaceae bacterium]|nr:HU family DNA-binding protein [Thermoleophilaceae bacterium]
MIQVPPDRIARQPHLPRYLPHRAALCPNFVPDYVYLIHPQHLLTSGTASPHGWQAHPVAGVDHFQSGGWITFRAAGSGRADAIANQIFTAIAETLVRGDGIEIRGFGSFTVRHYGAYEGRNPRTGAPSYVKAKRLP